MKSISYGLLFCLVFQMHAAEPLIVAHRGASFDAPENTLVWRSITRAVNREVPVVIVNQCISGPIDMNVYSKGRKQMQMGIF